MLPGVAALCDYAVLTYDAHQGMRLHEQSPIGLTVALQFESKSSRAKGIAFHPKR